MLLLVKIILSLISVPYLIMYMVLTLFLLIALIIFCIIVLFTCILLYKSLPGMKREKKYPLRISLVFIKQLTFKIMKEENKKLWSTILTIVKYVATAILGALTGSQL